jgi:hypothetical protein
MSSDLAEVLKNAAHLAQQAAEAASRGDVEDALRLQKEAETAWWRARQLSQRQVGRSKPTKGPSVRERAISALTELDVPSSPKEIAAYSEARSGQPFDVRALASIRRDEFRSWKSGSRRATYLVPALEGPWFVAGRGRFALSQWPLYQRIIGPFSLRTDHLQVCLRLADQIEIQRGEAETGLRLRNLLARYAYSIPGALQDAWSSGQELDVARVREAVRAELAVIKAEDETARKREAERAERTLSEEQLIWGGTTPQIIGRNSA